MNMFMNYQNPYPETPNNLYKAFKNYDTYTSKLDPTNISKPYELYDSKGNLEGYYWNYGDSINLEFNIDGEITIESTAIVLKRAGQDPNSLQLKGTVGQRCYNVIDLRSWTCTSISDHIFHWEEDPEFKYMIGGDRSVYINAGDYIKDKVITICLYNFRLEEIHRVQVAGTSQAILKIDQNLSKKLNRGIYYCSLEVSGLDAHETIFAPQDCKLLVK